jgi:hypothetical protein
MACVMVSGLMGARTVNVLATDNMYNYTEMRQECKELIEDTLYDLLDNGLTSEKVDISQYNIQKDDGLTEILKDIESENLLIYEAYGGIKYYFSAYSNSEFYKSVTITVTDTKVANYQRRYEKLNRIIDKMVDKYTTDGMSDYQLAMALHDALINRVSYGYNETLEYNAATAYGALVNKVALCEGYAKAYKLLLEAVDMDCIVVSNGEHAWNMVKIGKKWYHVDTTWDDTGSSVKHTYFLLSDKNISKYEIHNTWAPVVKTASKNYSSCAFRKLIGKVKYDGKLSYGIYDNKLYYQIGNKCKKPINLNRKTMTKAEKKQLKKLCKKYKAFAKEVKAYI